MGSHYSNFQVVANYMSSLESMEDAQLPPNIKVRLGDRKLLYIKDRSMHMQRGVKAFHQKTQLDLQ